MTGAEAGGPTPAAVFPFRHARLGWNQIRIEPFDPEDHIYRTISTRRDFYESDLLRYIDAVRHRAGRSVVIDVGANIGNHAVYLGKYLASHVIAIEPNGALLPVLRRNLEANLDHGSWSVLGCAVGAVEGTGILELPAGAGANVGMMRVREVDGDAPGGDRVGITTLDRIVADFHGTRNKSEAVGLVKIDVEGMEAEVLKGAGIMLERFSPDLLIEAADAPAKAAIESILSPYGYRAVSRHAVTATYHYVRSPSLRLRASVRLYRARRNLRRMLGRIVHAVAKRVA